MCFPTWPPLSPVIRGEGQGVRGLASRGEHEFFRGILPPSPRPSPPITEERENRLFSFLVGINKIAIFETILLPFADE